MSLQEKSEEKCSIADRLKKLRLERQWKWADFANKLGLSESMIYAVIAGRNSLGEMAIYRLEQLEKEAVITKVTSAAEEVAVGMPGSLEEQQGLFNRLVIEYGELKDKITTVEEIIKRMSQSRTIKSYRAGEKADATEKDIRTRAQIGAAKVLGEAQQAAAESELSQTGPAPSGKSAGPKVPSPPRSTRRQTPPRPAPK